MSSIFPILLGVCVFVCSRNYGWKIISGRMFFLFFLSVAWELFLAAQIFDMKYGY